MARVQPTLSALLAHRPFALRPLVVLPEPPGATPTIAWAHGTDLLDPTPFLDQGSVVLTTGSQLADATGPGGASPSTDSAYVARLLAAGVLALGYGSEIVADAAPPALLQACRAQGLPLFEVPYATPFVAIASWVAEERARAGRARADWGVRTLRTIAAAAHRSDGLAAALASYAEQTGTTVALVETHRLRAWDSAARALTPADLQEGSWLVVRQEAQRLLRDGRRAATSQGHQGLHLTFQTLGRAGELRGVLVRVGAEVADGVESGVLATAAALAGLALEQDRRGSAAREQVASAVLALAVAGHADSVRTAARRLENPLPRDPVTVVRLQGGAEDVAEAVTALRATRCFLAQHGREWVAIVSAAQLDEVTAALGAAPGAVVGASAPARYPDLARAHREAGIAASDATPGETRLFADLAGRPLDWVTLNAGSRDVAHALLRQLAPQAGGSEDLQPALQVWLAHGCQWDPAARALGVHRHTLRKLVERSGRLLGRDLTTMDARAELWWALRAAGSPAEDDDGRPSP